MQNRIASIIMTAAEAVQENPGGMLFASWSIIIVLAAMVIAFLRYGKKEYSIAVLPLFITPFLYIFSGIIARTVTRFFFYPVQDIRILITITAGLVSCLLLGPASRRLESNRIRKAFFLCCSAFLIILTIVFVVNILNVSKI